MRNARPRRARLVLACGIPLAAAMVAPPASAARSMSERLHEPLNTSITKAPERTTTDRRARFAFASSEPGSVFQCRLDKGSFAGCESPATYRRLSAGRHTLRVRAVEDGGRVENTPAVHRWKVVHRYDQEQDVEGNDIPPPPGSPAAQFEKECAEHPVICD